MHGKRHIENNPKRILFLWDVDARLRHYLTESLASSNTILLFPDPNAVKEAYARSHAPTADAIVGWRPSDEVLQLATKCSLYINPGAGVQHLIPTFRKWNERQKVILANGHGNAFFTAEQIAAMLLAAANQLFPHHQFMKTGQWRTGDDEAKSISLRTRKIGLLGYEHVNREVHRLLAAFGAEFHILRRQVSDSGHNTLPVTKYYEPSAIADFLTVIDVLIVTLPLTAKTEGLIGAKELALLGSSGFLIHAGRGPVIQERALYEALKNQVIAAAAIDVWYDYQPKPDAAGRKFPYHYPFHELNNILLSPHRAASPFDNLERWDDVIENIRRLADGRDDFLNVVDLAAGY